MHKIKSKIGLVAMVLALIVFAIFLMMPQIYTMAETNATDQTTVKWIDFSKLTSRYVDAVEGFESNESNKFNFLTGGLDLPNEFKIKITSDQGQEGSPAVVISSTSGTGDVWAAMAKPWDNGSSLTPETPIFFKDFTSMALRVKITNPIGVERILVRLGDNDECVPKDSGIEIRFRTISLVEGWQILEIDFADMTKMNGFDYINNPNFKIDYVQVTCQFNKEATKDAPAEIIFDDIFMSKQSVAPVMNENSQTPKEGQTGQVIDFTGKFDVQDNRNSADELTYSLSATVGDNNEIVPSSRIDGLKLNPNKPGTTKVTITAIDPEGNEGKLTITVNITGEIIDITPPIINIEALNSIKIMTEVKEVDLNLVTATDDEPNNKVQLSFEVENPSKEKVVLQNNKFTPDQNGEYVIRITATDPSSNSSKKVFKFSVSGIQDTETPEGETGGCNGSIHMQVLGVAAILCGICVFCLLRKNEKHEDVKK